MTTFTRPVPFKGTERKRLQNRASHNFGADFDGEIRCFTCDSKIWHVAADYPCGVHPPRETVTRENPTITDLHPGLKGER